MEWTEELIARLRALWQEGLSTAEIGRQLEITKNAVVGKAHRLGLPPRPSPIRRQASEGSPRPSRARVAAPLDAAQDVVDDSPVAAAADNATRVDVAVAPAVEAVVPTPP
ncbi:GcrA family cell cycle regulator, partial [Ameyamaea chiangmaiensis]